MLLEHRYFHATEGQQQTKPVTYGCIGIKVQEGLIESPGGRSVDTVAFVRSVDGDDGGGTTLLYQHQLGGIFVCHSCLSRVCVRVCEFVEK